MGRADASGLVDGDAKSVASVLSMNDAGLTLAYRVGIQTRALRPLLAGGGAISAQGVSVRATRKPTPLSRMLAASLKRKAVRTELKPSYHEPPRANRRLDSRVQALPSLGAPA